MHFMEYECLHILLSIQGAVIHDSSKPMMGRIGASPPMPPGHYGFGAEALLNDYISLGSVERVLLTASVLSIASLMHQVSKNFRFWA